MPLSALWTFFWKRMSTVFGVCQSLQDIPQQLDLVIKAAAVRVAFSLSVNFEFIISIDWDDDSSDLMEPLKAMVVGGGPETNKDKHYRFTDFLVPKPISNYFERVGSCFEVPGFLTSCINLLHIRNSKVNDGFRRLERAASGALIHSNQERLRACFGDVKGYS
jgi:hypothetical protein